MTIEVLDRGGFDGPNLLQLYCSQAQAFMIIFSMDSRASFDSIPKFICAVEKAGKRRYPIALVGMQKEGRLQVTPEEAAHRAAELMVVHFHVHSQKHAEVMGPFVSVARRHIQATTNRIWESPMIVWSRLGLWKSVHFWICMCFQRRHFGLKRLEDENSRSDQ